MNLKRFSTTTLSLVALFVLFVALSVLNQQVLRGQRIDLTDGQLYTLSLGTHNILDSIEEPIRLRYFFSDELSAAVPSVRVYAQRVRELLDEYVAASDGMLQLEIIDPQPFSEEEDLATRYGLQGVPVNNAGDNLYFGLVGVNSLDDTVAIPFFQADKEAFLEYDLSKLLVTLSNPTKPVIGLLSSLPVDGGFDAATGQVQQPVVLIEQARQLFEVRTLQANELDLDGVDVLMLVQPMGLDDAARYTIDQFILGGGNALIILDPLAELGGGSGADDSLQPLLTHWGVNFDASQVVGDQGRALSVATQPGRPPVQHLGILGLLAEDMAADDVVSGTLRTVNLASSGFLSLDEASSLSWEPLLQSSTQAGLLPTDLLRNLLDPALLLNQFSATGERYVLAARLSGELDSLFEAAPEGVEGGAAHRSRAEQPVSLILMADTDVVSDRLWVRSQSFLGQRVNSAFANNGDLVVNALDNLAGNQDLIGIRGQAVSNRPFTRVEALEREASARFLATEQQLQRELQDTERRLSELQRGGQADGNGALILTPEQQQELERFQTRKLEIRRELRQVRRQLDEDIDQLGTTLKVINIAAVPLLLSLFALGAWLLRTPARRRRAHS